MMLDGLSEWWINTFSNVVFDDAPDAWLKADREIINVVEKSAYNEVKAERDVLKVQLAECQRDYADAMSGACDLPNAKGLRLAENRLVAHAERIDRLEKALELALYYVESDATYEGVKLKIDKILAGE